MVIKSINMFKMTGFMYVYMLILTRLFWSLCISIKLNTLLLYDGIAALSIHI